MKQAKVTFPVMDVNTNRAILLTAIKCSRHEKSNSVALENKIITAHKIARNPVHFKNVSPSNKDTINHKQIFQYICLCFG